MTIRFQDTESGVRRTIPPDQFAEVVAAIDHRLPQEEGETDGELCMRAIEEMFRTAVKKHRAVLGQADDIITNDP